MTDLDVFLGALRALTLSLAFFGNVAPNPIIFYYSATESTKI
jgi:hypothetical protein